MAAITTETMTRIYDDRDGWYLQIAPDRDGGGIGEIRYSDGEELKPNDPSIVAPWPHLVALAHAIIDVAAKNYDPENE